MKSLVTSLSTQQLILRFFDLEAHIQSDSRTCLDLFASMYRRFQAIPERSPVQPPIEFEVQTRPDAAWGAPRMVLNGCEWSLHDQRLIEDGYVYEILMNAVLAGVRSHFLIHAGVVSYDDQGILLAADSRHGKTTLTAELVRRGCAFLSDDVAALGRADRRVHPFPRSLRLRPGTLDLLGCSELAVGAPFWIGKAILDTEELRPYSLGEAVAISHIIILHDPAVTWEDMVGSSERELGVLVDRVDTGFLTAVRRIDGVTEMHTDIDRGYPLLRLRTARRAAVLAQVEALCQAQQIWVLDIIKRRESHPKFNRPARLETIPTSKAIVELLRRFQGGYSSALLHEELEGSSVHLFRELAALIGQAKCYRLSVGPLHEMADLVCGMVNA
ncbi:MAG: hypothetical protein ETSY2_38765 [Candidatus Entotheonella gemina]|uniref:HPr kinase/phosphorylase C-terminal domain-containing protein n=1 Tax=Candidatus Entotheonella gemina TaxID=1429439 RepID=W4LS51_9BACT|nr:MAG: hypothetical protein ETSY2_38765 [Candidatus Entotheonella gemina]